MTDPTLAQRLRLETRDLHTQAERSGAMMALLRGQLGRPGYTRLLRNLHALYAALEPALQVHAAHPLLSPFHDPALARLPALEADLDFLGGPGWRAWPAQEAATEYALRLQALGQHDPGLLLAHAYVRYLGDLSGGQLLIERVRNTFQLPGDDGTRFYRFADASALAQRFRTALAALALPTAQADRLVAEAQLAFGLHIRLFQQLGTADTAP